MLLSRTIIICVHFVQLQMASRVARRPPIRPVEAEVFCHPLGEMSKLRYAGMVRK